MKLRYLIIICSLSFFRLNGQTSFTTIDSLHCLQWTDSILNTLSTKEKIAQLLCIRAYSDKTETEYEQIDHLVETLGIGGICFFKGNSEKQIELTNRWQTMSKVPLFITIDGETGLGMRLTDVEKFPLAMTMGAVTNDSLIYNVGKEIGKQCRAMGIQINFAPAVDVNTNPNNPVIGLRSFGENREKVAKKATAYFRGMQNEGVIAVAKHFPGHGDTKNDSHYSLPVVSHDRKRLDSIELYPFKEVVKQGIQGVMVAHLNVSALDNSGIATSISEKTVTNILKNELNFKGLVITDGLDMQGITNSTTEGETELKAFLAGNDILLLPRNPLAAVNTISQAVEDGVVKMEQLNEKCRKVLFFKILNGINQYNYLDKETVKKEIFSETEKETSKRIFENAVTLLMNKNQAIPLNMRISGNISVITYGDDKSGFCNMLRNFAPFRFVSFDQKINNSSFEKDSMIIVAVFAGSNKHGKYGILESYLHHIQELSKTKKVILCLFASPYSLSLFKDTPFEGLMLGYENRSYAGDAAAQILCGILPICGRLPVSAGNFNEGDGMDINNKGVLSFSTLQAMNINEKFLEKIDSIAQSGVDSMAYPGCQILLAKDGKVFYNKSFGYFTYNKKHKVNNGDLYDIASLTKIMATTPSIMLLNDQKKLDIDQTLGHYLPDLDSTDKKKIVIREVLAHQSRLCSWIPFYKEVDHSDTSFNYIYSEQKDDNHTIKIAENMYMRSEYQDTVIEMIIHSKLLKRKRYVYSDLGMILLCKTIEQITQIPFDQFIVENFYEKMNLATIGFTPLARFDKRNIVPTEKDTIWRKQLIHGTVHDMAAAMLGGVTGNAGIFSNAWDVASIMQMYLQKGIWNNRQYLETATVEEFTRLQFPLDDNRRGLGFDKPLVHYSEKGPTCKSASPKSFGHSGFTGCYAWADPENGLVYVFLSNRIYPDCNNSKLSKLNIRTNIHQAAYDAVKQ